MSRLHTCSLTKQDCVLPEKSKAHTPSWWNPFKTDMGFNISVSHMWIEESLPTWVNKKHTNITNLPSEPLWIRYSSAERFLKALKGSINPQNLECFMLGV